MDLVRYNSTDYPDPLDDQFVEIARCTTRTVDTLTILRSHVKFNGVAKRTSLAATLTAGTAPSAQNWDSITRSPELGLFAAVAQNGTTTQQIMTNSCKRVFESKW